jgi:DNA-binding MarR family transcriptional regulator
MAARGPLPSQAAALQALIDETRALFHRLRAAAGELHGQGAATAGRRGVLASLRARGPQTVPEMARARPVSRQHIQVLVNALARDGLVESAPNPAHRRSHLVRLTPRGEALIDAMRKREAQRLAEIARALPARDLAAAAATLTAVREQLVKRARRASPRRTKGERP